MAPLQTAARPQTTAPHGEKPTTRAARPRKGPSLPSRPDDDWREQGACREESPSLFFAPDFENPQQRRFREATAKAICARCPVRTACRAYALQTGELYGIWGGTTERERSVAQSHPHLRTAPAAATA